MNLEFEFVKFCFNCVHAYRPLYIVDRVEPRTDMGWKTLVRGINIDY